MKVKKKKNSSATKGGVGVLVIWDRAEIRMSQEGGEQFNLALRPKARGKGH